MARDNNIPIMKKGDDGPEGPETHPDTLASGGDDGNGLKRPARGYSIKNAAGMAVLVVFLALCVAYNHLRFSAYPVSDAGNVRIARNFFGSYGLFSKGEWILNPQYYWIGNYDAKTGTAHVMKKDERGFPYIGLIDTGGKFLTDPIYISIGGFDEFGLAVVEYRGSRGVIDTRGKTVIKPEYCDISKFDKNGVAVVSVFDFTNMIDHGSYSSPGLKYGLVNAAGKVLAAPVYDSISVYSEHKTAIIVKDKKYGLMDLKGKITAEIKYDRIESFDRPGVAEFTLGGVKGRINSEGRVLTGPE